MSHSVGNDNDAATSGARDDTTTPAAEAGGHEAIAADASSAQAHAGEAGSTRPSGPVRVGPFTLRETIIAGIWLLAFIASFFPRVVTPGSGSFATSVWVSGIDWILLIGVPTIAVFLLILRRLSPTGIRRVGSLGIDQFASVAFTVAAVSWLQVVVSATAVSVSGFARVTWVPWFELVAFVALVVATVFAPLIPGLAPDFDEREPAPAHRVARGARVLPPAAPRAPRPPRTRRVATEAPAGAAAASTAGAAAGGTAAQGWASTDDQLTVDYSQLAAPDPSARYGAPADEAESSSTVDPIVDDPFGAPADPFAAPARDGDLPVDVGSTDAYRFGEAAPATAHGEEPRGEESRGEAEVDDEEPDERTAISRQFVPDDSSDADTTDATDAPGVLDADDTIAADAPSADDAGSADEAGTPSQEDAAMPWADDEAPAPAYSRRGAVGRTAPEAENADRPDDEHEAPLERDADADDALANEAEPATEIVGTIHAEREPEAAFSPEAATVSAGEPEAATAILSTTSAEASAPHEAPAVVSDQPFWALVPADRPVVHESTRQVLFTIGPTAWALVVEDRGSELLVRHEDGRVGVLDDVSGIMRG